MIVKVMLREPGERSEFQELGSMELERAMIFMGLSEAQCYEARIQLTTNGVAKVLTAADRGVAFIHNLEAEARIGGGSEGLVIEGCCVDVDSVPGLPTLILTDDGFSQLGEVPGSRTEPMVRAWIQGYRTGAEGGREHGREALQLELRRLLGVGARS